MCAASQSLGKKALNEACHDCPPLRNPERTQHFPGFRLAGLGDPVEIAPETVDRKRDPGHLYRQVARLEERREPMRGADALPMLDAPRLRIDQYVLAQRLVRAVVNELLAGVVVPGRRR